MLGVIEDTLRRMQTAPAARHLPSFTVAFTALADAERDGLTPDTSGRFRRVDIQKLWPSPYGRAASRSGKPGGGVAPRQWDKRILERLKAKFMQGRRDMTREDLMAWVERVPFSDPEKRTAYVRRAIAAAIIEILLRRQCRCPDDSAAGECIKNFGRRFCFTREEGAALLTNVWSWLADGPLPQQ
jgi:hypothetical protein